MSVARMPLPTPRGPLSEALLRALVAPPAPLPAGLATARLRGSALDDDDLQLSLAVCYELHYRGVTGVDDGWEWDPSLLALRARFEREFLRSLTAAVPRPSYVGPMDEALRELLDTADGPSLSRHLQHRGTLEQYREFAVHRSLYQLKEADPHTWGVPRLTGRAKAALVEIQSDEYGGGQLERMHSRLFARTMRALGLDDRYGAYVDAVPAASLANINLVSMFGLHRRWRGALLGHLAVLEMDSSIPNQRYADGLRRLGLGADATEFFDEHVLADAVHASVAAVDMCGSFAADEPELAGDVLFGAACCIALDARVAESVLDAWAAERSSLRPCPSLAA